MTIGCDGRVAFVGDQKVVWVVEFGTVTGVHDQDSVGIDDCSQSVSDDEHSAALERVLELILNEVIRLKINVGCSLIKNQDLGLSDDSSSQANKLLLSHGEEIIALSQLGPDSIRAIFGDVLAQIDVFENLVDFIIREFREWIQIFSD